MDNKEKETPAIDRDDRQAMRIQDDEIDLYALCNWNVLVKRKMVIIQVISIFLLGAVIYSFMAPKIYRVEVHAKLHPTQVTAKDLSSIIGKVDRERKAIIFSKNPSDIQKAEIINIRGTTDKFKIRIDAINREHIPSYIDQMIKYIENIPEIKRTYDAYTTELDEKIKVAKEGDKRNDIQIKEIEKRLINTRMLSIGFDPIEIRNKSMALKMEIYRLERERQQYKIIRLMDAPFVSQYPVKPKKALIITLAGIIGLMCGIFIIFIMEYFERRKNR